MTSRQQLCHHCRSQGVVSRVLRSSLTVQLQLLSMTFSNSSRILDGPGGRGCPVGARIQQLMVPLEQMGAFAGLMPREPSRSTHDLPTTTDSTVLAQTTGIDPRDVAWESNHLVADGTTAFVGGARTTSISVHSWRHRCVLFNATRKRSFHERW